MTVDELYGDGAKARLEALVIGEESVTVKEMKSTLKGARFVVSNSKFSLCSYATSGNRFSESLVTQEAGIASQVIIGMQDVIPTDRLTAIPANDGARTMLEKFGYEELTGGGLFADPVNGRTAEYISWVKAGKNPDDEPAWRKV